MCYAPNGSTQPIKRHRTKHSQKKHSREQAHAQTDTHTHHNTHTPPTRPPHTHPHTHLPCCCLTHLPTACCRGGWDASRGARAQAYLQRTRETPPRRERSGSSAQWRHAAHDDSALYTQSKASQQQAAMKPSRPRRGDSFT